MNKPKPCPTPEELFNEATEGKDVSPGELRLLTSGLYALRESYEKTLNNVEFQAMSGMVAYVAYTQDVSEETVREILTAHYNIAEVKALPSRLYQDAIEYLVDLEMDKAVN